MVIGYISQEIQGTEGNFNFTEILHDRKGRPKATFISGIRYIQRGRTPQTSANLKGSKNTPNWEKTDYLSQHNNTFSIIT